MHRSMRFFSIVGMMCLLAACGEDASKTSQNAPPVKGITLGFSAPMSGDESHYGRDYRNGAMLALEDINSTRVVIGGHPAFFELLVEDDQASPKMAAWVANKMVEKKVAGLIGPFNSATSIFVSNIYAKAGIPLISMATAPQFTQQGLNNTFRSMVSDTQQGKILGEFVAKRLNAKRVAVIDDQSAYGQGLAGEFIQAVKHSSAQVVKHVQVQTNMMDFTAVLTDIKREHPDLLFWAGADVQAAHLVKQMKKLGMNMPMASGEMSKTDHFLRLAGDAGEGSVVSLAGLPIEKMPKGEVFLQRYKDRFKETPGTYAPYGYDAARVMMEAIKLADTADPKVYMPVLAKIEYKEAITTPLWSYDAKGNLQRGSVSIFKMEKGHWRLLEVIGGV